MAFSALAGAVLRLFAAWCGLGLWNAGHDHLHVLKLAQPAALTTPAILSAADPGMVFGDGLLRPLMRHIVAMLHTMHLGRPEQLVLMVGLLAVLLRLVVMLGLWRIGRGYIGVSRMGHRAWLALGFLQGALGVVVLGGVLALGPTPQGQLVVALRNDTQAHAVIALGASIDPYYLGERELALVQHDALDERWLRRTLDTLERAQTPANRFVFLAKDRDKSEIMLILEGQSCQAPTLYVGSWLDRLAVALDPARHVGRGALLLYRCSGTDMAALMPDKERALGHRGAR